MNQLDFPLWQKILAILIATLVVVGGIGLFGYILSMFPSDAEIKNHLENQKSIDQKSIEKMMTNFLTLALLGNYRMGFFL